MSESFVKNVSPSIGLSEMATKALFTLFN